MLGHRLCQNLADLSYLVPLGLFSRLLVSPYVTCLDVYAVGLNFGPGGNLDEWVELATVLDRAALENTGLHSEVVVITDVARLNVRAYFKRVIAADSHRLLDQPATFDVLHWLVYDTRVFLHDVVVPEDDVAFFGVDVGARVDYAALAEYNIAFNHCLVAEDAYDLLVSARYVPAS